jgi:hypothetical protein
MTRPMGRPLDTTEDKSKAEREEEEAKKVCGHACVVIGGLPSPLARPISMLARRWWSLS